MFSLGRYSTRRVKPFRRPAFVMIFEDGKLVDTALTMGAAVRRIKALQPPPPPKLPKPPRERKPRVKAEKKSDPSQPDLF